MRIFVLRAFLLAALLPAAWAQETPTEREAAKQVLRKMGELEKSLDIPGLTARVTAPNAERDKVVARAKELMDSELIRMGDAITRAPEIGFQEDHSIKILMDYLNQHNFVTEAPR